MDIETFFKIVVLVLILCGTFAFQEQEELKRDICFFLMAIIVGIGYIHDGSYVLGFISLALAPLWSKSIILFIKNLIKKQNEYNKKIKGVKNKDDQKTF